MGPRPSHCCHCGAALPANPSWPKTCRQCRRTTYLNPLPVVVLLVPVGKGLVVIRRNTEPMKGTLTLPGGFLDCGESWQEGGKREVLEETGINLAGSTIRLYDVQNGLDNTLVIFGLAEPQPRQVLKPFRSAETQEVALIEGPQELGFPLHTAVVARYFSEEGKAGTRDAGREPRKSGKNLGP